MAKYVRLEFYSEDLEAAGCVLIDFPNAIVEIYSYIIAGVRNTYIGIFVPIKEYRNFGDEYIIYQSTLSPFENIYLTDEILQASNVNRDVVFSLLKLQKETTDLYNKTISWDPSSSNFI